MFHTFFYQPLYNLLVFVLTYVPLHDIGMAIILVTLFVKVILLPLNMSALRSQYLMKKIEGEMKEIREKHKDNPQESGKKMMELYKREKVNPFASLFVIIIQLPIIIALYQVFSHGFRVADTASLYSFITFPVSLHTVAFGLFDVTEKSIVIAVLAAVSSYFLARRQTKTMIPQKKEKEEESLQEQFIKSMQIQMLYVLPVIVGFSAAVLPAALGFYWTVSNIITYFQDIYMKHKLRHLHQI